MNHLAAFPPTHIGATLCGMREGADALVFYDTEMVLRHMEMWVSLPGALLTYDVIPPEFISEIWGWDKGEHAWCAMYARGNVEEGVRGPYAVAVARGQAIRTVAPAPMEAGGDAEFLHDVVKVEVSDDDRRLKYAELALERVKEPTASICTFLCPGADSHPRKAPCAACTDGFRGLCRVQADGTSRKRPGRTCDRRQRDVLPRSHNRGVDRRKRWRADADGPGSTQHYAMA